MDELDAEIKLVWAEKRLIELEAIIAEYRASDPYEVRPSFEGNRKKKRWRLYIEPGPPIEVGLILGEFLYGVRAALDYIAADLVKPSLRSKSYYPFLSERIWEVPISDKQSVERRVADRRKWAFVEREMPAEAVEIIKRFHPPNGRPKRTEPMYNLSVLNVLSNKDRHRNLNIVAPGLDNEGMTIEFIYADGTSDVVGGIEFPIARAYSSGAEIRTPPGVVNVKAHGTVAVSVNVSTEWADIRIPDSLLGLSFDVARIIALLKPHIRAKTS
jgi:hypothetical protein